MYTFFYLDIVLSLQRLDSTNRSLFKINFAFFSTFFLYRTCYFQSELFCSFENSLFISQIILGKHEVFNVSDWCQLFIFLFTFCCLQQIFLCELKNILHIVYQHLIFNVTMSIALLKSAKIGLSHDIKSLLLNSVDKKLKIFIFNF